MLFFIFFFDGKRLNSYYFFFSSRRRHTRSKRDWSSDVCSSDLRLHLARFVGLVHVGSAALRRVTVAGSLLVTTRRRRLRERAGGDEKAREGQGQCTLPALHAMPSSGGLKSIRLGPPPHLPPRPGPSLSRPGGLRSTRAGRRCPLERARCGRAAAA